LEIDEPARAGLIDHVLAWAAMAPLVLGAAAAWLTRGDMQSVAMSLVIIWGGAILAFLAGVRRGLSFRTPGGAQAGQIAMMLWIFALAFGSMIALRPLTSLALLMMGFVSLGFAARAAAARAQTPLFFARLRPGQMTVAALSLGAVAARLLAHP
jgi:hypothetical protein